MLKHKLTDRYHKLYQYLESFIPLQKKRFPGRRGLERMRAILSLLDNPHLKYPTVHVVGTSGKGSTATIMAQILIEAGYKTGLTLSPHLQVINERIKVDGRMIGVGDMEELVGEIRKTLRWDSGQVGLIKKLEKSRLGRPTYFELLLAMAFMHFAKRKVDIAVVEAGLGGKFDGTNVIKPLVGIITNVGLDHTEVLGRTVEEIATDKAGIIEPGMVVISGVKQESVERIIEAKAKNQELVRNQEAGIKNKGESNKEQEKRVFLLGRDFGYQIEKLTDTESVFHYNDIYHYSEMRDLELQLVGKHQVENTTLAIAGVVALRAKGFLVKEEAIRQALKKVKVPGRLEVVQEKSLVILDGAHNEDKIKALVEALPLFSRHKWIVVFAAKKDKPVEKMIRTLLCKAGLYIITEFRATTDVGKNMAMPAEKILAIAKKFSSYGGGKNGKLEIIPDARQAVKAAIKAAGKNGRVLITGSLYLVGEVRERWYPKDKIIVL